MTISEDVDSERPQFHWEEEAFRSMEIVEGVVLMPDEWTPESGLVTAAQMIRRGKNAKVFADEMKVRLLFEDS